MILFKDLSEEQKAVVIEKMEELYLQKYCDQEIAENISKILGDHFHTSNVRKWRRLNKLIMFNIFNSFECQERFRLYKEKAAKDKKDSLLIKERFAEHIAEKNRICFDLYNQGYSDREMARVTNTTPANIRKWRKDNKLFKHENKLVITGTVTGNPIFNHSDNGDFYKFSFSYQGLNKVPVTIEVIVRKRGLFPAMQTIREKSIIKIADGELYFERDNQLLSPKIMVYDMDVLAR